jgi:hypothetical protein
MKITFSQILELPFMLNISNSRYLVKFEGNDYELEINSDLYAVVTQGATTPSVVLITSKDKAFEYSETQENTSVIKLRSVLTLNLIDFPKDRNDLFDKDFIKKIQSELSRQGDTEKENIEQTANDLLVRISSKGIDCEIEKDSLKIYSRARFRTEFGYDFIKLCNHFIKHYCVAFEDRFAQEISLHHVCETTCGGVIQITQVDGVALENSTLVGKIPPILKKTWFTHDSDKTEAFKKKLSSSESADEIKMLIVRAWNMFERGAYRSAIIESSAALEAEISIQIQNGGVKSGKTLQEMQQLLFDTQRFDLRCKKLIKEYCGFSIPELDNVLWTSVKSHRANLRNNIAHSTVEPAAEMAEKAIQDFSKMIEKIRKKALACSFK